MSEQANFDICLATLRDTDRDRYLACLLSPEDRRGPLAAIYAFAAELARIRDLVHEPLPGEVRLQYWRDLLEGQAHGSSEANPLAAALLTTIERYRLPRATFVAMTEARIFDLYDDPMPSRTDLEGYCGETASALIQLAALVLDPAAAPAAAELAGHAGCAQAVTGLLQLLPLHRSRGQCYIPADILASVGSSPQEFLTGDGGPNAGHALAAMIALARDHLAAFERGAGALPESLRPAFLPLALTRANLDRIERAGVSVLRQSPRLPHWRRHWLLFRRATRGW